MAQPYNFSSMDNATTVIDVVTTVNTATGGFVGPLIYFVILAVFTFALLQYYGPSRALFAAGIISGFSGLVFIYLGWLQPFWLVISVLLAALAAVAMYAEN